MAILEIAVDPLAYSRSPAVYEDWPVPPFAATRVPPTVTAPVVEVAGVNPVVSKLIDVTPVAGAGCHDGIPALIVSK
jgi:hypothetical protein